MPNCSITPFVLLAGAVWEQNSTLICKADYIEHHFEARAQLPPTVAPFAMIRKIPVKETAKPRKKRREKPSPFSRKWARRAVKKGTTATIIPTLEAKV